MKIQVLEASTNRPLANTKIQLQVKGKDSGFISLTSDASGHITLDEKISGQQVAVTTGLAAGDVKWTTATDGARLLVASTATGSRTTETTQGGRSSK